MKTSKGLVRVVGSFMVGVALAMMFVPIAGCGTTSPTVSPQPMTRAQTLALDEAVWGPLVDPVLGIRVDGTKDGKQLYFFVDAQGDTASLSTDFFAVQQAASNYWMPR
jgi:hypothetical protein